MSNNANIMKKDKAKTLFIDHCFCGF